MANQIQEGAVAWIKRTDNEDPSREVSALLRDDAEGALHVVLERFGNIIQHLVRKFSQCPEDREDLFQEVVLKLWEGGCRRLASWDPDRSALSSYLFLVVWRICRDYKEKEQRLRQHFVSGTPAGIGNRPDLAVSSEDSVAPQQRSHQAFSEAVSQLDACFRALIEAGAGRYQDRVLVLLRSEGYSAHEVAVLLDLKETAVNTRYSRVRKRLRECMASHGFQSIADLLTESAPSIPITLIEGSEFEEAENALRIGKAIPWPRISVHWGNGNPKTSDLNRIVELAMEKIPPDAQEEWEEIESLDPEVREGLMALREISAQEMESAEISAPVREIVSTLSGAHRYGNLRVAFTNSGLLRVCDPKGDIEIRPWIAKVFDISKRMIGRGDVGVWPTERLEFSFPVGEARSVGVFRLEGENPHLSVRCVGSSQETGLEKNIDVEYWRGRQWIGAETLCAENPELILPLEPKWPYLLQIRRAETIVLRVTCYPTEFSSAELRIAALVRVLVGDIDGGFELIRSHAMSPTPAFSWVLSLLGRCLPEPALQMGYSAVRDAATQTDMETNVTDLFKILASGWLVATDKEPEVANITRVLEQTKGPIARGFLFAFRGGYEEALTMWELADEASIKEKHVRGASLLAGRMLSDRGPVPGEIEAFEEEDLDIAFGCLTALGACRPPGKEDFDRLAETLARACCSCSK